MDPAFIVSKQNVTCKKKVRTGCTTCRARKVKCDESKPSCRRCVSTGRHCGGYEILLRHYVSQPGKLAPACGSISLTSPRLMQRAWADITPRNVDLLERCFTTKTVFGADLGCKEDARRILEASLHNSTIQHAVLSLTSFRKDFDIFDGSSSSLIRQSSGQSLGLERYNLAINGLTTKLLSKDSDRPYLALLCCQLFISIEHLQGKYDAMAQHIIRGLRIMREHRSRPTVIITTSSLGQAHHSELAFLDVYIIKLFVAPCKLSRPPARIEDSETNVSDCMTSIDQQPLDILSSRTLAHDTRSELKKIATSILEFLGLVSELTLYKDAVQLISKKHALLDSLQSWLIDFEKIQTTVKQRGVEPTSASLLRLFHCILEIILLGTLNASVDSETQIQIKNNRLQNLGDNVTENLRPCKLQALRQAL